MLAFMDPANVGTTAPKEVPQAAAQPGPGGEKVPRDPRVDFFRGVALLTIFSSHLNPNWVKKLSPSVMGFCDSAELFVFLSGYVTGLIYFRLLNRGVFPCLLKAYPQACKLYIANACTLVVTLGCLSLFFADPNYDLAHAGRFLREPARAFADYTRLAYLPWGFGILTMYMSFLAVLPGMLWVAKRGGVLTMVLLSFLLYVAVQVFPNQFQLPQPWRHAWFFNPMAWQFLYFLGVATPSVIQANGGLFPARRWIVWLAIGGLVLTAAFKIGFAFLWDRGFFDTLAAIFIEGAPIELPMLRFSPPWTDKPNLEPLRIINFACLVAASTILIPRKWAFWNTWPAQWIIRCGQQALFVFCLHSFLVNIFNVFLVNYKHNLVVHLLVNLVGWCILLLAGNLLAFISTKGRAGTD